MRERTQPDHPSSSVTVIITSRGGGPALAKTCATVREAHLPVGTQLILVSPAPAAARQAAEHEGTGLQIEYIVDRNLGRTHALNSATQKARGQIVIVLTDYAPPAPAAIELLVEALGMPGVDAVGGRPMPADGPEDYLHFWQTVLCDVADRMRRGDRAAGRRLPLAGELFGFRRRLLDAPIPTDCPYPEMYIAQLAGSRRAYVRAATAQITSAPTFAWWLRAKTHTLANAGRDYRLGNRHADRFRLELTGISSLLRYATSVKTVMWLAALVVARSLAWLGATAALRVRPVWVADSARPQFPFRTPMVMDVYEMRPADLGYPQGPPCRVVVREVIDDDQLRVVPRLSATTGDWGAIPSRAEPPVFPLPGSFLPLALNVTVAQLGQYRGRCPAGQWRHVRTIP